MPKQHLINPGKALVFSLGKGEREREKGEEDGGEGGGGGGAVHARSGGQQGGLCRASFLVKVSFNRVRDKKPFCKNDGTSNACATCTQRRHRVGPEKPKTLVASNWHLLLAIAGNWYLLLAIAGNRLTC